MFSRRFIYMLGADGRRRPRARGPTTRTCGETGRTFGSPRTPSCPPKRCTLNGGRTRASTHARLLLAGRAFTRPGPGGGRPALLLLPLIRACEVKDACVAAFPLLPRLLMSCTGTRTWERCTVAGQGRCRPAASSPVAVAHCTVGTGSDRGILHSRTSVILHCLSIS